MAISVSTHDPKELLEKLKKAVSDGDVTTWKVDSDGHFEYVADQYAGKAWFAPTVLDGMLVFGLVGEAGVTMKKTIYGVYHGRFVQMLLTHFDDCFSGATVTALGNHFDRYKAAAQR